MVMISRAMDIGLRLNAFLSNIAHTSIVIDVSISRAGPPIDHECLPISIKDRFKVSVESLDSLLLR